MSNLTRLNVALTLTTASFNRSVAAAQTSLDKFGKSLSGIGAIASRGFQIGIASAVAGTAALAYGVKKSAESIDAMAKASDRLGVSMDFMGGLTVLSKDAEISVETLEKSMLKLNTAVMEAGQGSKSAQEALAAFGLTANQLSGLTMEKRMLAVADATQKLGTSVERNTALIQLFGKEGASLALAFEKGSGGLKKAEEDAKNLGVTVSRLDAAKVEEMNDAFDNAGIAIRGALNNLTIAIAPLATAIADMFTNSSTKSKGFKDETQSLVDLFVKFAGKIGDFFQTMRIGWGYVTYAVSALSKGIYTITADIVSSAKWWGEAFDRVWKVITTGFDVVKESLQVGWAYLKVPLAQFVQFTVGSIADMVRDMGELLLRVNKDLGQSLMEVGLEVRASVGSMAVDAEANLTKVKSKFEQTAEKAGAAWKNLFSEIKVTAGSTIDNLLYQATRWYDEEKASLDKLKGENWYSDDLKNFFEAAKAKSNIKAKQRADDAAARQAEEAAALAENARKKAANDKAIADAEKMYQAHKSILDQSTQDQIKRENDAEALYQQHKASLDQAVIDEKEREKLSNLNILTQVADLFGAFDNMRGDDLLKAQQRWSMYGNEYSKFLNNLAVLQQSNDKRMRAIGKVAAKAQIVTATAVAAIESIKSFSGLGPWGVAAGYAAAAAAIAAGAVQLANVDRGTIGTGGGGVASTSIDSSEGVGQSRGPTQTLVVQGDYLTPETLARLFAEAKEKGIQIEGVRRA